MKKGWALFATVSLCACGGGGTQDAGPVDAGLQKPTIGSFRAMPSTIQWDGGVTVLSFTTTGAESLSITPGVGDVTGKTSQQVTVLQDTTFTLTATNAAGTATAMAIVDVEAPPTMYPVPVISSFTASPASLGPDGGTTRLGWSVLDADVSLTIDRGVGDVSMRTFANVNVTATTTFTLTAVGRGGMATSTATVTLLPPPPSICAPAAMLAPALAGLPAVRSVSLGGGRAVTAWSDANSARYAFYGGASWGASTQLSALSSPTFVSLARDSTGQGYASVSTTSGGDAVFIDGTTGVTGAHAPLVGQFTNVVGTATGAIAWVRSGISLQEYSRASSSWTSIFPPLAGTTASDFAVWSGSGGHVLATWINSSGELAFAYQNGSGWESTQHYSLGFETNFDSSYAAGLLSSGDFVVLWQDVTDVKRTWLQRYRRATATFDLPQLLQSSPALQLGALPQVLVDPQDRVTALWGTSSAGVDTVYASRDFGVAMQPPERLGPGDRFEAEVDPVTGTVAVVFGNPLLVSWAAATGRSWVGPLPTYLSTVSTSYGFAPAFGAAGHVLLSFANPAREVQVADCTAAASGFDGGAPFTPDAGPSVDAGTPNYTFQVVEARDRPVPGAYALLIGPTQRLTALADSNGNIAVDWPVAQRPFDLTVVAAGHEAVSVLGITAVLPQKVRIDTTVFREPTPMLSGSITGKTAPTNRVSIDVLEGFTPPVTTAASWSSQYLAGSPHPIVVVAIELDAGGNPINWTKTTVARPPMGGTVVANLAFPSPAGAFRSAAHTVTAAPSGLLSAAAVAGAQSMGALANYILVPPGQEAYVNTGIATGGAATVTLKGIDDVLVPNRLTQGVAIANGQYFVNQWVVDPFTSGGSTALPVVTQVTTTGFSLGDVAVNAAGVGFDTLELQISVNGTTFWRAYTAPGAPLSARLPDLPAGFLPANMLPPGAMPQALALLIKFESAASVPWLLPGGDTTQPQFRVTVGNTYTNVAPDWR